MGSRADVVVIGSGINGLSAAALLAKRGRRVLVLESADVPGGAVRTAEVTLPGFRHDLFAMNLGLFVGGPVAAALRTDLVRHGFGIVASDRPFCSLFPDEVCVGVQTDAAATRASVAAVSQEDAEAWDRLGAQLGAWAPHLVGFLQSDLPSWQSLRALRRAHKALGSEGLYELIRLALTSTRSFGNANFSSREMKALLASWGMHLDFAPDIPGGALFSYLETLGGQVFGMAIGHGGADTLTRALVSIIEENGGEVRCGSAVTEVTVEKSKARGVILASGEHVQAGRAVISNINPSLMPDLLPDLASTKSVARAKGYEPGLATMMIHLALDAPAPWINSQAAGFNYVHIGPYVDDMAMTYAQAASGSLPTSPTLVVGQPTVSDPSRAPHGKHILWVQVRVVPGELSDGRHWDDVREEYADRVLAILETYAPGLGSLVLKRFVLSPTDLQRHNASLVQGDSLGGSHHPAQFFFLRPVPGWGRHRTPVKDLYICGAGTWPGGGVSGASGAMVASAVR